MQIKTTLPIEVRNPESTIEHPVSSYCLDFISSDASTDRHTEAINPSGWKLDNYRRNPVFQNSHQYGDILFTLGKALITDVRDVACGVPTAPPQLGDVACGVPTAPPQLADVACGVPTAPPQLALFQRIEFACDINPMAKIAYGLYKGGFLSGVSVGFVPLKWQEPSSATPSTSPRRVYLEQELLEVSAVAIPANPNALALAYKSGALEKSDLRELSTLLKCTLSAQPTQPSTLNSQPLAEPSHIKFLRALHHVLRKT